MESKIEIKSDLTMVELYKWIIFSFWTFFAAVFVYLGFEVVKRYAGAFWFVLWIYRIIVHCNADCGSFAR